MKIALDPTPFYNHPKADDALVGALKKASKDAGIEIGVFRPARKS